MKKIFISLLLLSAVQPAWANLFTNDMPDGCDASVIHPMDDNTANLRALFERDKNVNINLLNQPNVPNACYQSILSADGDNATMHALFERDENVNLNLLNQTNIAGGCVQSFLYPDGEDSTMRALFEPKTYDCDAGYYLPANTDGCTICPENSYCMGGTYTFNATETQGITACPDGLSSESGASDVSDCISVGYTCPEGEYLPMNSRTCTQCSNNNYCPGGTYPFNETETQGITAYPDGLFAPAGMWQESSCGRILHIDNNIVYLRSVKVTTPSLNIDIDGDGTPDFFGNMTTNDVYMHDGADKKFKVQYNGQTYSVYDDTIVP